MSTRAQTLALAAAGAALALHGAALSRVHGLLAGAEPTTPGFAIAAGVLLGWGLGASGPAGPARAALLAAGALSGLFGVLAPLPLGSVSGPAAGMVSLLLAAVPAAFVGWAAPGEGRPPLLLGAGLGALLAAFVLLPQAGPTLSSLLAGGLLVLAALVAPGRVEESATEEVKPMPLEAVGVLLVATCIGAALGLELRPWPFGFVSVGCASLGAALGSWLRLPSRARIAAVFLAALALVPWAWELLPISVRSLVGSDSRPLVGATWGAVALLCAGLAWGFGPGLLAGLTHPRPRPAFVAFAGGLVGLFGLLNAESAPTPAWLILAMALGIAAAFALKERVPPHWRVAALALVLPVLVLNKSGDGGFGRNLEIVELERGEAVLRARGHDIAFRDPRHAGDEILAGQLAGLLATERRSALLVGLHSGRALEALRLHGFEEIELRETCTAFAVSHLAQGLDGDVQVAAAPSAWPARDGGWDALVVQADDPSVPAFAPVFTDVAYRRAAEMLAPGGVFVQRLRISRLGPEGLAAVLRMAEAAFPVRHVLSANQGRDGVVLLVGRSEASASRGLPWDRLVIDAETNPRLSPAIAEQLKEALLFKSGDLVNAFAAGPRELAALDPDTPAFDPWTPGSAAFRWSAPEAAATSLARALLYARIGTVELEFGMEAAAGEAPWEQAWPFAGLETQLAEDWHLDAAYLRFGNRYRDVLGDFGVYRDASRKIAFERDAGRIEVSLLARSVAGPDTLGASARSFLDEHATRTLEALVHGHRALVVIREPSASEQHVHMTWHCPVQARLYAADYRLDDGKPGLFEEPLEELGRSLRCAHDGPAADR